MRGAPPLALTRVEPDDDYEDGDDDEEDDVGDDDGKRRRTRKMMMIMRLAVIFFCLAHLWGNIQSYLSVTLHYNSWLNNCYCQLPLLSASFSTLAR